VSENDADEWHRLETTLKYGLNLWAPVIVVCVLMYMSRDWEWTKGWPWGLDTVFWISLLAFAFHLKAKRSRR
jgi:hypothetical protein